MRELCGFAGLCGHYAAENIYASHLCDLCGANKIYNILIIFNILFCILNILFCKYSMSYLRHYMRELCNFAGFTNNAVTRIIA